jgi:ABC-type polysaccharide/polyol phosphate transport system ATPase subunit
VSAPAIEAAGLGKCYRLARSEPDTLAGSLAARALNLWRRTGAAPSSEFWALRDVGFTIAPGDAIGIIGPNGAGKSTLLKILSRVIEPSTGTARLRGRVASLLEIGTGFHPDLSARQNIFLNGAILGMRRSEITRRLDQIVDYAGIADFLHEPVKHLSSGMYLRLAFSVASFLESEIMIVDEVLAVGDAAFQKKSLGTMRKAAHDGRTVLFVSHNLPSISQLTRRCLVLEAGAVAFDGPTADAIQHYLHVRRGKWEAGRQPVEDIWCERRYRRDGNFQIREIGLPAGQAPNVAALGQLELEFVLEAVRAEDGFRILYAVNDMAGHPVLTGLSPSFAVRQGRQVLRLTVRNLNLVPGEYDFTVSLGKGGLHDRKEEYDAYMRFGHLSVSAAMADGQLFGSWMADWASTFHHASSIQHE